MPIHFDSAALKQRIMDAVQAEATDILHAAQERAPVDTGRLKDSGKVVTEGDTTWVSFGADDDGDGGSATNTYAVLVHEDLAAYHDGGQAKFLSSAADEASAGFAARVAKRAM